jgi:DNA-binding MurR/RpiR family transcriptional regulator
MTRTLTPDAILPPATIEAFRARLADLSGQLPRRLQQCADHLAAHQDNIAVSTVAEIAAGAGVPPSAVMRFCQILGFSGYSEMQRLFRNALSLGLPDYGTRLANLKSGPADRPAALVAEFVEAGRLSLEKLTQDLDESALNQAVETLSRASVIHLAGYRRALPVATYLSYVFEKMAIPAMLHDGIGGLDHRTAMRPGDALLAVTFAPYSSETLSLAAEARARGLPVVVLTDPPATPLLRQADLVLSVAEVDFGAFRSLSATTALALSLAVAVATRRQG